MMDPPSSIPSNRPWMTIESPMEARVVDNSCQNKDTMNDCTPKVGMEFDTLEAAWMFWKNYGKQMGFSVRKYYTNKSKIDGEITSRRFLCSKEGTRKPDKRDHLTSQPRQETRTNCLVRLGVSLVHKTGKYKVYDFASEHNHVLHLATTTFMMRLERKMSDVQAFAIDLAYASGIKPKEIHELMSREAGGRANLGYTRIDQKNYLRTRRQRSLIYGEAGSLLSFDTTFGTNKEFRPLAVFIGFNHHREMVIFGAALLYDEIAKSFKWLFESFLKAHGGRKPKSIFTDQDFAIAKALAEVFDILDIKIIPDVYILKRWTREEKNGYVKDSIGKDVHGFVNLKVTQRYKRLCPRLVRLASRAAEIKETYTLVESVTKELVKQVEDIAMKFSSVSLDNSKDQMSLGGSEIVDHGEPIKDLVEKVKGLKKKEGRKGQKRCKSWVEQQSRRKKKTSAKDTVRQQLSKENNSSSLINYNNSFSPVQCYSHKGMDVGFDQAQVPLGDRTDNYDAHMNFLGK
ncbi:hypothetical protein SO802_007534 [Lithocarpus litseifolius]|uniref:Protein FAR1-RELATED SEQUENCE n=1 Tax=Lithocarpus litseifolius TaxID=425828 RepID=A0AAW2DUK5_9ROSI